MCRLPLLPAVVWIVIGIAAPWSVTTARAAQGAAGEYAAAARDTVTLLGGPGRWDGRFETSGGAPDWHGWTSVDHSASTDTVWTVSTFRAAELGGHGPGNRAMWCGGAFAGGDPGYGNGWQAALEWVGTVADPGQAATVVVESFLSHDTEPGFDRVVLRVQRAGGTWQDVRAFEGWRTNRAVHETIVMAPGDYQGAGGDEVRLRWLVVTDGMWSDEDGLYPTEGACQLDDVRVSIDGAVVTFDDFEPGHPARWTPYLPGVGDFAHLAAGLQDLDPCVENASWQVCFVDDGVVVPGSGGSPCFQWCYGPGGYVLHTAGGPLGQDGHLHNAVVSPPLAWPTDCHQAQVSVDVWRHDLLTGATPGMAYRCRVRSTADADPAALALAPWQDRGELGYGDAAYVRHGERFGDLLAPGRRWVQVELAVYEVGWLWGLTGDDATPAPYFDNVCVQAWPVGAPEILVRDGDLPQDTFPANGALDAANLGVNDCRFDMARNISPPQDLRNDPGDTVVVTIASLRPGSQWLVTPRLHLRIHCNPLFDAHRILRPPVGQHFIQGQVQGDSCRGPDGRAIANRWSFSVPDQNLLYPGDVVHVAFEAMDIAGGAIGTSFWPADTTGFHDFGPATRYPRAATMRALPSLRSADGAQPPILVWRDFATGDDPAAWDLALANLGFVEGVDYDVFVTRDPDAGLGNGLGGRATASQIAGYRTILYGAGDHLRSTLATGDHRIDASADLALLSAWMQSAPRNLLLTGDDVAWSLHGRGAAASQFLSRFVGLASASDDASGQIGGQVSPRVLALAGNPLGQDPTVWRLAGGCPGRRAFDALLPTAGAQPLAEFATPEGDGGAYPLAAALLNVDTLSGTRTITLPSAFAAIVDDPGADGDGRAVPARTRLLGAILGYFGQGGGEPTAVPSVDQLAIRCHPNPFNPTTTLAFMLPTPGRATLKVYDLRGRLVRVLLDGDRPAGPGVVVWDGTDGDGAAVASGIYVHELVAGGQTRLGKMTLVK